MSDQRDYIGQAARVTLDFIEERGFGPEVRRQASPGTALILAKPPWPFAWGPGRRHGRALETLVAALGGRQACVDLASARGARWVAR